MITATTKANRRKKIQKTKQNRIESDPIGKLNYIDSEGLKNRITYQSTLSFPSFQQQEKKQQNSQRPSSRKSHRYFEL
jgi:hypothetical protein